MGIHGELNIDSLIGHYVAKSSTEMSKFVFLGLLGYVAAQVPGVAVPTSLGGSVFAYDEAYADNPDIDPLHCSEADCNAGSCDRIWVYEGNDSFEEFEATGVCSKDAALELIAPFLIEKVMVKDDLGQMMLQIEKSLMGRAGDADAAAEGGEIRRFKNLKSMVMTLQPANVTVFGRYCYYGCWCLPNGQHNLASGFGQPVDPVDEVCKEFAMCYKCLEIDFGGSCNPETRHYRWGRILDGGGIPYDIKCKDNYNIGPTHRCKRYTCECDRVLAVGLASVHWYWNVSMHARWGDFDREASCFPGCRDDPTDCLPQDDCCGAYGSASTDMANPITRRPYATTNPDSGCCQDVYFYDVNTKECCYDAPDTVTVVPIGDCLGTVMPEDEIDDFGPLFPGYSKK